MNTSNTASHGAHQVDTDSPEAELVAEMRMLAEAASLALGALVVGAFIAWLLMGRPVPGWFK